MFFLCRDSRERDKKNGHDRNIDDREEHPFGDWSHVGFSDGFRVGAPAHREPVHVGPACGALGSGCGFQLCISAAEFPPGRIGVSWQSPDGPRADRINDCIGERLPVIAGFTGLIIEAIARLENRQGGQRLSPWPEFIVFRVLGAERAIIGIAITNTALVFRQEMTTDLCDILFGNSNADIVCDVRNGAIAPRIQRES